MPDEDSPRLPSDSAGTPLAGIGQTQARLIAAVQELSLARSLPAIQEIVRSAARQIVRADGATFVLREGDNCHYADEDAISPLWKGQRFPMSACVSGWAMLSGREAVIPDIFSDPRIPAEAYRPTFVKSLVMVPIRREAPIGAIGVYWATRHEASAQEVELLQALANTTSVAMENVQVYLELEQRVASRTRELEWLNRELEAFSFSVSHDLRAPVRHLTGFVALLESELGGAGSEKVRSHLRQIRASADRMGQLIDDLLRLSRFARAEVRRREVDLAQMAREVVARLRATQPERQVEFVMPEHLRADCDPGLIAVVLENLIGNAWKYTARVPAPRIEFGELAGDGTHRKFFVRDNGAGFDPEHAGKLFLPFQRLHSAEEFPGTGIGLATVQRIVQRHGGEIRAEAAVGRGATFSFSL